MLDRRDLVRTVLKDRGELLVVAGLGAPAWDLTAAGDTAQNLPLWGGMGGAAMVGLGLALAQPGRRVLVLTGDGEMLMGIGSLATLSASLALRWLRGSGRGRDSARVTPRVPFAPGLLAAMLAVLYSQG